jgi:formate/nitrite transporter FocA (FNT family)
MIFILINLKADGRSGKAALRITPQKSRALNNFSALIRGIIKNFLVCLLDWIYRY